MDPQFAKFIEWSFYSLITGISVYGIRVLSKLTDSVEKLNLEMGKIHVHMEYKDKMDQDFESRLRALEYEVN